MKRKAIAVICAAVMLVPAVCVNADYKESDLKSAVTSAIKWKNDNDSPFYSIGQDGSNLYITALKRLGRDYDYASYLSGMDGATAGYDAESYASDMQRSVLAVIAAGGDAQNVGGRDLVADSTYYRDASAPLERDGVDGYAWALIALDAGNFETPEWAIKNRDQIISGLLSHQNTDGSFDGDVYTTASAVTALAPYCETSGAYTVTQNQTGYTIDVSPKDAANSALGYLSETQTKDGDWGNLISTSMAVIAIDAMNLDADGDSRFTARNGTAIDGLMSYQNKDGGFSFDTKKSDGESTSYAICALASHLRKIQGKSRLFRLDVNDTVTLSTPAPTAAASSSSASRATTAPRVTSAPRTAATPRVTAAPSKTMQPTKTTAPRESVKPTTLPTATPTPRPTRRPDLVGPVEMPGPMPTHEPYDIQSRGEAENKTSFPTGALIAVGIVVLLAAAAAVLAHYMKRGKKNTAARIGADNKPYKAKRHRRTEQHRRFEQRGKYKLRKKYKK